MFEHTENCLDYDDLKTVNENKERRYNTPEGNSYPSVTTVLGLLSIDSIMKWRKRVGEEEANKISTRASQRGTKVHAIIEKYIDNDPNYKEKYTPDIIASFLDVKKILDTRIGKVYAQEAPLYSDYLRLAGRVDCVAEFDGKLSIIDFKTSRRKKTKEHCENYFIQESAYAIMWEERTGMPITQLVTIIAVDSEEPIVFIEHRDNHTKKLVETIELYERRQRRKRVG